MNISTWIRGDGIMFMGWFNMYRIFLILLLLTIGIMGCTQSENNDTVICQNISKLYVDSFDWPIAYCTYQSDHIWLRNTYANRDKVYILWDVPHNKSMYFYGVKDDRGIYSELYYHIYPKSKKLIGQCNIPTRNLYVIE